MAITYTYEVVSVDETNHCMEVKYSSEGKPTITVGISIPEQSVSFEAVIDSYVPLMVWLSGAKKYQSVKVGTTATATYVLPQEETNESKLLRKRFFDLVNSDWTQLPDSPLSEEEKQRWAKYRQELRDITKADGFPDNVVYPTILQTPLISVSKL